MPSPQYSSLGSQKQFRPLSATYRLLKRYRRLMMLSLLCLALFFWSRNLQTVQRNYLPDDNWEGSVDQEIKRLDQILLDVEFDSKQTVEEWLRPSKKVAIVTMFTGSAQEIKSITFENMKQYAARHEGYTAIDAGEDPNLKTFLDETDDLMMTKFYIIRHYLDFYDWVFWCDGDSIFLNHGLSFEDAGAIDDNFDLTVAVGHAMDWHWGHVLNNGHFMVRSSPWSMNLMDTLWQNRKKECPKIVYPPLNGWLVPCGQNWYWFQDQGALHAILRSSIFPTDFACHVKWVNMRDINSELPWYDDGDLIVHLPGKQNDFRKLAFAAFNAETDFSTGKVRNKQGPIENDIHDWRVQKGLFDHYLGAGWNVPCRDLYKRVY